MTAVSTDANIRAATRPTPAVQATGLTRRFGEITAVDRVDLTIGHGEVVALLGPNGAGKSTTIDLLLGLGQPDAGKVTLFGLDPQAAIRAGRVGAVLQSGGLLPDLTVREIVTLSCALHQRKGSIAPLLTRAGVSEFARQRVGRLSGGQQQRVRFAMALAAQPDLLVLDEPTTGLDVEARRSFWSAVREETAKGGTVLFATHYLDEADSFADRIILLRGGQVIADGTSAQIKSAVSGRTVRATLPGAELTVLTTLPGVSSAEIRGDTVLLACSDSDATLRALLNTAAHDIEVTAQNLEDAFLALTVGAGK
jgi:ABC-2 type transport system ATP-binding protein